MTDNSSFVASFAFYLASSSLLEAILSASFILVALSLIQQAKGSDSLSLGFLTSLPSFLFVLKRQISSRRVIETDGKAGPVGTSE